MGAVRCGSDPSSLLSRVLRGIGLAAVLLVIGGCGFSTQPVEALVGGGPRFFSLEWHVSPRSAERLVQGYVKNDWGFVATNVRLLVEGLEPPNRIVSQRIFSLGGDLAPGTRAYFETPMPPSPTYRVRVFAFDWIQSGEMHGR
jgi:hypothetical protein